MSIHEGLSSLPGRVLSRRRISSPAKNPIAYASWTAARSTSFKARRVQRIFSLGKVQRLLTAVSTRLSATLGSSSLGMWTCIAPVLPEYKIPHQSEHSMRRSSGYLLCGDRCSDFRSLGDLLLRLLNGSLLRRHFHWTLYRRFLGSGLLRSTLLCHGWLLRLLRRMERRPTFLRGFTNRPSASGTELPFALRGFGRGGWLRLRLRWSLGVSPPFPLGITDAFPGGCTQLSPFGFRASP